MKRSLVIGVFSAKGGVGKSLIASNLGAVFAERHKIPTVLVDLAAGLGGADLLLDVQPERTWADLLPVMDELMPQHLELAVTPHASGLHLLASPEVPDLHADMQRPTLEALLAALGQEYTLVLLDVPTGLGVLNVAAFHLADIRLVVMTPDAPALRATQRYVGGFAQSEKPVGLVLNQYGRGAPVNPKEIGEHINRPVYAVLPVDSSAVWANISYGKPCALKRRRGLGHALRRLASATLKAAKRNALWEYDSSSN